MKHIRNFLRPQLWALKVYMTFQPILISMPWHDDQELWLFHNRLLKGTKWFCMAYWGKVRFQIRAVKCELGISGHVWTTCKHVFHAFVSTVTICIFNYLCSSNRVTWTENTLNLMLIKLHVIWYCMTTSCLLTHSAWTTTTTYYTIFRCTRLEPLVTETSSSH